MKYEVEIPDDVNQLLAEQANRAGEDVVHVIQLAVVRFVQSDAGIPTVRRRPDSPAEPVEIPAPYDFPRSAEHPIPVDNIAQRRPDPLPETA